MHLIYRWRKLWYLSIILLERDELLSVTTNVRA